jgi:hypothetical protein
MTIIRFDAAATIFSRALGGSHPHHLQPVRHTLGKQRHELLGRRPRADAEQHAVGNVVERRPCRSNLEFPAHQRNFRLAAEANAAAKSRHRLTRPAGLFQMAALAIAPSTKKGWTDLMVAFAFLLRQMGARKNRNRHHGCTDPRFRP